MSITTIEWYDEDSELTFNERGVFELEPNYAGQIRILDTDGENMLEDYDYLDGTEAYALARYMTKGRPVALAEAKAGRERSSKPWLSAEEGTMWHITLKPITRDIYPNGAAATVVNGRFAFPSCYPGRLDGIDLANVESAEQIGIGR